MPTSLSLDRFAELAAELESGRLVSEVLGRAGLSTEEWSQAQEVWLDAMGRDLEAGRFELSNRYSEVFLRHQHVLAAPPVAAPMTPLVQAVAAAPVVREAKPTYLAAGAAGDTAPSGPVKAASPSRLAGTMNVDVSAFGPALPFAAGAPPAPPPPAAHSPGVKRPPSALSGTSMALVVPKGPALPFAGPPAPPAPALESASRSNEASPEAPKVPPVKRPPAALAGTSMAVVIPKGPSLPFSPKTHAAESAPAAPSANEPRAAGAPVVKRAPAALSGTSMAVIMPKLPALPFSGDAARAPQTGSAQAAPATPVTESAGPHVYAAARPSAEASPWAADVVGTLDGALPRVEATIPFDPNATPSLKPATVAERLAQVASSVTGTVDKTAAPTGPSLPFAAPAEPPPLGFSIEQYASLCVEIAAAPVQTDEVLRRYQISAAQRETLDAYWQGRIAADPSAWMGFDRAYSAYKAWWEASRGR